MEWQVPVPASREAVQGGHRGPGLEGLGLWARSEVACTHLDTPEFFFLPWVLRFHFTWALGTDAFGGCVPPQDRSQCECAVNAGHTQAAVSFDLVTAATSW